MSTSSVGALFEAVNRTTISAVGVPFVARERFVPSGARSGAVAVISSVGKEFYDWFLLSPGIVETIQDEQVICSHRLLTPSYSDIVVRERGGVEKVQTTLSALYTLIINPGNTDKGPLCKGDVYNRFFVVDQKGILRMIIVDWVDDGWCINARMLEDTTVGQWSVGDMVFFPELHPK